MPIPLILRGLGVIAAVAVAKEIGKDEGIEQGKSEAKAEFDIKHENIKKQIDERLKSVKDRDKVAILMCKVAISFANTGGEITEKEKNIIESVICGKAGMTDVVRAEIDRYYDLVSDSSNEESDFYHMLKQVTDNENIDLKDIVNILTLLEKCSPEKSDETRKHYIELARTA